MDDQASARTAVIVAGGEPTSLDPSIRVELPEADVVVAADSGFDVARTLGITVDVLVGDLDSISPSGLAAAEAAGVTIERHPVDKDKTDLELALDAALQRGATRIVVVVGDGGRLDMALANLLVLAAPTYAETELAAFVGRSRVFVIRGGRPPVEIAGRSGDMVTLLPVHGPAEGVRTEGLRFPLEHEPLGCGTTRGCSNELLASTARVGLDRGTLLCLVARSES